MGRMSRGDQAGHQLRIEHDAIGRQSSGRLSGLQRGRGLVLGEKIASQKLESGPIVRLGFLDVANQIFRIVVAAPVIIKLGPD